MAEFSPDVTGCRHFERARRAAHYSAGREGGRWRGEREGYNISVWNGVLHFPIQLKDWRWSI